jgi:phosphoglycolate phosphatase-like HAD superfamily hydrolase
MSGNKLVLFDLDGTLIKALRPVEALQRFRYAIRDIFGHDVGEITKDYWKDHGYNGRSDRYILWDMLKDAGVSRDHFINNLGAVGDKFVEHLDQVTGDPLYAAFPEAKKLADMVIASEHLHEGVLTGNLIQGAAWKLHAAGYPSFSFGVFGNEADNRDDLSRLALLKAKEYFGHPFAPSEVVIVGDTVNDISCARAIGSPVVIVKTGWNVTSEELEKEKPDLLVDSLLDERVISLLGLKT